MVVVAPLTNKYFGHFSFLYIDIIHINQEEKLLILKKKRINKLSCLSWVEKGQKIIIALYDAVRFKGKLEELGFSMELKDGEKILPAIINLATARNAEKFYVVDRTQPKEKYYQTLWWTRHEWAGRGETREVSDFVDIPRERFPRIEYLPYSVELTLKYDEEGHLLVVTDPIEFCERNEKLLINTVNIFRMSFGECGIMTDNFEELVPTQVIRLNWEVLPQGEYPWERVQRDLEKISERKSKTARKMLLDKCEYIDSFYPDFRAYGKSGFSGYVIFGFKSRNMYVLESVYTNNATYVFGADWEKLSKLSKAKILNAGLQDARLIHNDNWKHDINELLGV